MHNLLLYPVGTTQACRSAASFLEDAGIPLVDHPAPEITHVLLDVPSFQPDGTLRGGGDITDILERLPRSVTVIGGNLHHPALAGYPVIDLLKDEGYLAKNAAITADCALRVAMPLLPRTFADSPTLIIGWGRIGKCLGFLLQSLGAEITIAARKEADRGMIHALGFQPADMVQMKQRLSQFRLILNTAPEPVLRRSDLEQCRRCVKIDLASKPGLEGDDIIWSRGLPGIHVPESSGKLIADTFLRQYKEVSQ